MRSIPNRLGRKQGRFSVDFEVNEINAGLRGHQQAFGDSIDYYRFQFENSTVDDVYDEGSGEGKVYLGPIETPAIKVIHAEGPVDRNEIGFYFNDDLHVTLTFDSIGKIGLTEVDIRHQNYLKDRIVYDDKVFRVHTVQVLGQVQRRDTIVSIEASQVKPDELVNDAQFARWSA